MPTHTVAGFTESDTANIPGTAVTVATAASTLVVAANVNRIAAVITNDGTNIVYLSLGGTAAVGSGIRLNASGGSFVCDFYTGQINARAAVADVSVGVSEV